MRKTFQRIISVVAPTIPLFAMAAASKDFKWLVGMVISNFIKPATWLIMSLAVVFFLWNMAMAVKNSDNSEELEKFKSKAVWGIVAIAAMISMWGLVNFVTSSLNLETTSTIVIPALPSSSQ